MQTIYQAIVAAGVETGSWSGDLYAPVCPAVEEILNRPEYDNHRKNATKFKNQIDGTTWYDIPFAYDPFWEAKCNRSR